MKKLLFPLLFIFISNITFSQKEKSSTMGKTTLEELKMTIYDKDSTAAAVVLYEHSNRYPDRNNDEIPRTDYYYRIKILDKSAFDLANISINLYDKQRIEDIKAITYNLTDVGTFSRTRLLDKDIFTIKEGENWKLKKFTLPNIKVGSVIEYTYSILSPYLSIKDWNFQSEIPKIKSELDLSILGNYKYNMKITGSLKLDKDEPSIHKRCVIIDGIGEGNCATFSYGMNNIPAFKEEDYMLSKKNYISKITFDLKSHTSYRGVTKNLTTTWEKADKSLKKQFFNNQTSKISYFKKNIPEEILTTENTLDRAKKVFDFIKNHYTWNNKNWTNEDAKVKQAFQDKTGDVGEINISLYNSLKAANLNADLVVLSTRNNGIPTKIFPVIYDYNYVIVKTVIDNQSYYLDATDHFLPFGQVPFKTLNGEARVINFKDESNWVTLKPRFKSSKSVRASLILNEDAEFTGNLTINRDGYFGSEQRKIITSKSEDDYLEAFESNNPNIEIEEYKNINLDSLEKSLGENFKVNISLNDELTNITRINPFFFLRTKENPFKLEERNYPVNFGYPSKNNYYLRLKIPENYKITQLPKDLSIALPNKGGHYILKTSANENIITVFFRYSINRKEYSVNEYYYLKEFYKQIIIAENSYIILEKK